MQPTTKVSGYEAFRKAVSELYSEKTQLNIYFTGEKDERNQSWCPDCNDAEPFVFKALADHAEKDAHFLVVDVGDRTFWKDMKNPFRKDSDVQISVIPTLLRWKSPARLNGEQCSKINLLETVA